MVNNLPAMQVTQLQSLSQEDPLEKGMAPTPVFLPGKAHEQRSLVVYSPWIHKELDTTEWLTLMSIQFLILLWIGIYLATLCLHFLKYQ